MTLAVPEVDDRHLPRLLREIGSVIAPLSVDVMPDADAQERDCFPNVLRKIEREGGTIVYGWQLWTWPNVLIEGEFHALWRSPDGDLLDITPKQGGQTSILFAEDTRRIWLGEYVDNVRLPLRDDLLVEHLLALAALAVRLATAVNADQPGDRFVPTRDQKMVKSAQAMVSYAISAKQRDHDPCPCGEGGKYKRCCGPRITSMLTHFAKSMRR